MENSSPAPVISKQNGTEKKAGIPSVASSHAASKDSGSRTGSGIPNPETASNGIAAKASPGGPAESVVLHKVLPTVSDRAQATIRGTVHVAVKVDVDPSGNVTNATLDTSGPSKYFTDLSLQAARDWKFKPAQPTQWVVHFLFTQADTTAFSTAP
jgi:TonB family protein